MPRRPRRSRLGDSRGVPVLVPVRASPVPSVVRGSFVVKFFPHVPVPVIVLARASSHLCRACLAGSSSFLSPRRFRSNPCPASHPALWSSFEDCPLQQTGAHTPPHPALAPSRLSSLVLVGGRRAPRRVHPRCFPNANRPVQPSSCCSAEGLRWPSSTSWSSRCRTRVAAASCAP